MGLTSQGSVPDRLLKLTSILVNQGKRVQDTGNLPVSELLLSFKISSNGACTSRHRQQPWNPRSGWNPQHMYSKLIT